MTELARAFAEATGQDYTQPWEWQDKGLRSHQRMASRLATYGRGRILYVNGAGWHAWDGTRWAPDEREARAHAVLTELLTLSWQEAMTDKDLASDVNASMTAHGSAGVLSLASRQLFTAEVDSSPYLLNCQNGTLDLHTLQLRPHDPADHITKATGCAFDPSAYSEDWEAFLSSSLPDEDVRGFLQRYAGLALIGRVIEHVLVIATGSGRNGKGVLARALSGALGDYAITASNDMLIASRYGQRSAGELASRMRLRGARWAVMSELEKGDKLAESTMKSLTGGDTIEAKFMGQNPVEFDPSHTFFMLTNDLPKVDADATAVWARMRIVPFDVSFIGREDPKLEERLELNRAAILAWAVLGLAQYQDDGLAAPPAVLARTESYRADNDDVQQFLAERCVIAPAARVTRSELHHAYMEWARDNDAEQLTPRQLAPKVRGRNGVTEGKSAGKEIWKGLGLRNDQDELD
ncbi:phage/plasmid primase, P4 family [Arthrobacter ginkgonis]|uniref:Phage/plasmid primase, P4 family n=1 Tax=Arthrobacter ginkgonis TaxID=1630594 RepID=A0ABP7C6Y1_9MICC